jgi:exopolyphosphatase/guanosine-5'-triphosphate,3'-diphosphate pyrophosphatase
MVRAVISLGTNSTRLLVVCDRSDGAVVQLEHAAIGTRLGEGLEHGRLGDEAMNRTLDAIVTFMSRVRAREARVSCIATSAMRRASNAAEFAARVAEAAGAPLQVLSGSEEAAASFAGATYGASAVDAVRVAVVDVGGGSTECGVGHPGRLEDATSLEIGAVRLTERFPALGGASGTPAAIAAGDLARPQTARLVAELKRFRPVGEVRAVGGTPTTLGAIAFSSDVDSVSERTLSRAAIDGLVERMLALDLAGRRALPGMLAQRADILPAGGLIISEALGALGVDSMRIEANDLLLGYLLQIGPPAAGA